MADERERGARARGDVVHGALAPLIGALAGGTLALGSGFATAARELPALAHEGLSAAVPPEVLLTLGFGLVARAGLPVLASAMAGALVLGVLQTRGYFGSPTRREVGEPALPQVSLALIGWVILSVLALDALRTLLALHAGAAPGVIAGAAVALGARGLRSVLVVLVVLALVDHLLRVRARRLRLGLDEPAPARRTTFAAPALDERLDALVQGVSLVLFDEERAVALGRSGTALVIVARARGLAGVALREAARRRGLPLRAAAALEVFDGLVLGEGLPTALLGAYRLDVLRVTGASQ